MRNRVIGSLAASVLAMMLFSSMGLAQAGQQGRGGRATLPCLAPLMTRMIWASLAIIRERRRTW
jgi:hypothetical protein